MLNHLEDAGDKLLLSAYIQEIITCYFSDKLTEDFVEISGEEIKEEIYIKKSRGEKNVVSLKNKKLRSRYSFLKTVIRKQKFLLE